MCGFLVVVFEMTNDACDLHGQYVDMRLQDTTTHITQTCTWWRKCACKPLFARRWTRLTLTLHFQHRSERADEQRQSSREGWLRIGSNTIYSLRSCRWTWMRMSIMISSHCMQLDYYSMQITWLDILSHYSHIISFFKYLLFPKKFSNNVQVPSCVCCVRVK